MIEVLLWIMNASRFLVRQVHDFIAPSELVVTEHITGFWRSAAILTAVELRLADIISQESLALNEIARRANVDEVRLERLLNALCSIGFFKKQRNGAFKNSRLSHNLRFKNSRSAKLGPVAEFQWRVQWSNWEHLGKVMSRGCTSSFIKKFGLESAHVEQKQTYTLFDHLEFSSVNQSLFHGAMSSITSMASPALLSCYPWNKHTSLLDIGGGDGSFLRELHQKFPELRKCVLDRKDAQKSFELQNSAAAFGFIEGDFFKLTSEIESFDALVLKHILHDWRDEEVLKILQEIKRNMNPGATLLVIETIKSAQSRDLINTFADLEMMHSFLSQERDLVQYQKLFQSAGFVLKKKVQSLSPFVILVAKPQAQSLLPTH